MEMYEWYEAEMSARCLGEVCKMETWVPSHHERAQSEL